MKRLLSGLLLVVLVCSFSGCQLRYEKAEDVVQDLDCIAGKIGHSQITEDDKLIGVRTSDDDYTGGYTARCKQESGCDVIFGGGSVRDRTVFVSGKVLQTSGNAAVRVRQNGKITEYAANENGTFEITLHFSGGGNYIMVEYEDFTGTIELHAEYKSSHAK